MGLADVSCRRFGCRWHNSEGERTCAHKLHYGVSGNATTCKADGVPLAKTRCSHFAALRFQAARRLLSQNAQIYEPECHCCGAYLKPLCQEAERLLIVEIKIMFSDIYTD
jgi:hypothetical protein